MLYDNDHQVQRQLAELQQKFRSEIISSSHIPLIDGRTMQVIFVQGPACRLNAISDEIVALRGVMYGKSQLWPSVGRGMTQPPASFATPDAGRFPSAQATQDLRV